MMISGQVLAWLDKCQSNIERMQCDGVAASDFRDQYGILETIPKVAEGRAYFLGTTYKFHPAAVDPKGESQ